ncbi:hypothetical protein BKA70DRAFT_1440701 [Coprinopsis sp. MPI-PUGE-AT-0042]|nr:hypothetical protein BKA70DRAFT_1440701 [Coprinopsis sp. MPI-PUGE-AT-0042]
MRRKRTEAEETGTRSGSDIGCTGRDLERFGEGDGGRLANVRLRDSEQEWARKKEVLAQRRAAREVEKQTRFGDTSRVERMVDPSGSQTGSDNPENDFDSP